MRYPIGRGQTAHPRSRGEHVAPAGLDITRVGSSPLTRGTSVVREVAEVLEQLIPARAGNIAWSDRP